MNEFELDQYLDNIDDIHDKQDWEQSYENQYLSGLCDGTGTPIINGDNW